MSTPSLVEILLRFSILSLLAVGGANAVLPEMQAQTVTLLHWLSKSEFSALYAVAQAAPGPNVLIVSLIGWKVAGIPGALVATLGMCGPSSVLAFQVGKLWQRYYQTRWRRRLERALAPITIGLILASACRLMESTCHGWLLFALALGTAAASYLSPRNPLWWLALAALLGATGLGAAA